MRRKSVLFIDDMDSVHKYTKQISQNMNLKRRAAFHPDIARKIIARRVLAANKMIANKKLILQKTSNPTKRRALIVQIERLKDVVRSPFDLIVSDINMPHGDPSGERFARELKSKHPSQRILMHSDEVSRLKKIEDELDLSYIQKIDQKGNFGAKEALAEEIEDELDVARRHLKWLRGKRKQQ